MKIALVSPYDFAYIGGVTSHILSLERYLSRMGHEVKVIAPASRQITDFGDRFIQIGKPRSIPASESVIRISISLNLGPAIKEVLDREKFDIIHLHEPFMPMLCSAILRFSKATNVGTFHAWDGKPGYNWGGPITTMIIKRRQDKIHGKIAVSNMAMAYALRYVKGDYTIIPNGIDVERFSPDVEPFEEFCDGKKNILFLGRLEPRKGLPFLIKAYYRIKKQIPDIRLIVAGRGSRMHRSYERWTKKHGVEDVVFTGYVSEEDKPRYFKTADIYCSPAIARESFGIVLLEGMAVGKPVIASNIAGYSSVVTHGEDGILVPPKNINSLADALTNLLTDDELRDRLSKQARITAESYSWELISQRIMDVYQKALNRPV